MRPAAAIMTPRAICSPEHLIMKVKLLTPVYNSYPPVDVLILKYLHLNFYNYGIQSDLL